MLGAASDLTGDGAEMGDGEAHPEAPAMVVEDADYFACGNAQSLLDSPGSKSAASV